MTSNNDGRRHRAANRISGGTRKTLGQGRRHLDGVTVRAADGGVIYSGATSELLELARTGPRAAHLDPVSGRRHRSRHGVAPALGAAAGSTSHTVLLQGDGDFKLGIGELASAVQAKSGIVVCLVVVDDDGYGMLRAGDSFALATPRPRRSGLIHVDIGAMAPLQRTLGT